MQIKSHKFYVKVDCNLLDFLTKHYGGSPTKLKKLIKNKLLSLNGNRIKTIDEQLKVDDIIEIHPKEINDSTNIDIIYEDENIVAVNKQAGILSVNDQKNSENIFSRLKIKYKNNIYVVHRIDQSVSGLIIFAKNIQTQKYLESNWKTFTKQYYTIVEGQIVPSKNILKNQLVVSGPSIVYINDAAKNGDEVITEYDTLSANQKYSELMVTIHTGKKNQIRAQLSHHGYPIIGDKKFNSQYALNKKILLHSWKLILHLPTKKLTLEAPIPNYFKPYTPNESSNENS